MIRKLAPPSPSNSRDACIFCSIRPLQLPQVILHILARDGQITSQPSRCLLSLCNGLHVIRRSDHEWAGLSCDYVIEICLMRNLKTSGSLTHGSGMIETQRNQWTLSRPVSAEVHNAVQELTATRLRTGEQNKDFGPSRVACD